MRGRMKLNSLSDIFQSKIFRIPDYQRGYAWQNSQISAFWDDIIQLDENKSHYTGVLTLEPVPKAEWEKWEDDIWLIGGVGYNPFYVVDGQQRLTTSMILLKVILERLDVLNKQFQHELLLNYQSAEELKSKYMLRSAASTGIKQSYLFGYEKDDPSNEFLKTRIFGESSSTNNDQITLYTSNLANAKSFFINKLNEMQTSDLELIYKKLTTNLKFNIYEINEEIDVFITFETMNNRGRALTSLELLKNRLIYLSTLFSEDSGSAALRKNITSTWKTIYKYLGKNASNPLDENEFLRNHWIMYFTYTRRKGDDYINFLLNKKFTRTSILAPSLEDDALSIEEINEYIKSLQNSAKPWFYMHNPCAESQLNEVNEETTQRMDRLFRLGFKAFKPLILASLASNNSLQDVNSLLAAAERYNFTIFSLCQRRSTTGDSEFYGYAADLLNGQQTLSKIIELVSEKTSYYFDPELYLQNISERYKRNNQGFYDWAGLTYLLYEYEECLHVKSRNSVRKLEWNTLHQNNSGTVTIEHIYPQTASEPYWEVAFNTYSKHEQFLLTHSLGNLVPLSRSKNSSLQNYCFLTKVNNGAGVGYYNGSAAENEIAILDDWDAQAIFKRGMDLLAFMEKRWQIVLGNDHFKAQLLHLSFLETIPTKPEVATIEFA